MHEGGGNCLKYLNRGWKRKEGRGNKDFKKGGGQAGSRGWCLKKGGSLKPLQTMDIQVCEKSSETYLSLTQCAPSRPLSDSLK